MSKPLQTLSVFLCILFISGCSHDDSKPIEAPLRAETPLKNKLHTASEKTPRSNHGEDAFDPKLRIKLRYDAKGNYSWEITGMNLKQIIETDKVLRKKVGMEKID